MVIPSWTTSGNDQVGAGWPAMKLALQADEMRCSQLPKATGAKTNLTATFPSQVNAFSSALSLPENRHYLGAHTGPGPTYSRFADIQTLQNAPQLPDLGAGASRSNGAVLFPDGEILLVPSNSTQIVVFNPLTEAGRVLALTDSVTGLPKTAPGNTAFLGGALWIDGISALLCPHNSRYAWLVNKNTGVVTVLTGYNFLVDYACAGVRRVGVTGEYFFVPHMSTKFVLLDPVTMTFRELPFAAPGAEAYVDCTNLSTGELYVATHKAACSVVIDVVAETKIDTLPPSGAGYVAPTPGISNFRTCKRTVSGGVLLAPYKHTKAWLYDRATNRHTQCPGTYNTGAVGSCSMTMTGDTMLWPWNENVAYKLSTGYGFPVDPQIVTSPLFNGF